MYSFVVGFSHQIIIKLHYVWRPTRRALGKRCRTDIISRTVIWTDVVPSLVVLKPRSHCRRRHTSTHSAPTQVVVRQHVAIHRRAVMYGAESRPMSTQDNADAKIICYLPLFITSPEQRNDGRQCNIRRCSVRDWCRRNRLQLPRFSLVTNIVAITQMRTGCESSRKFFEAQVIGSSLDR